MYEIWLAANIVYEIALDAWPLLLTLLLVWLGLVIFAVLRNRSILSLFRTKVLRCSVLVALATSVILFLITPWATKASFAEMGYWVDWANLVAIAGGFGAAAGVFFLPVLAIFRK